MSFARDTTQAQTITARHRHAERWLAAGAHVAPTGGLLYGPLVDTF
jgi:hypothetical protein